MLDSNKKRWFKLNPDLPSETGIYILTRVDEKGFKFAYIGQTKAKGGILERLAQHSLGYQHIDLSLKKHKLYSENNPYGWQVDYFVCLPEELDAYEQEYILKYSNMGYQLRNKTSGSQGIGKTTIEEKSNKGYRDGLKQGYKNCLKDIKEFFEKYLDYQTKSSPECYKKPKRKSELPTLKQIYVDKFNEFKSLLEGDEDEVV